MNNPLTIRTGARARATLLERGFDADLFSGMVGASGGPKWMVLSQLDRVLAQRVVAPRSRPLAVLGSSIGSFRHACLAQADPLAAIDRFEQAYIGQAYEREPTALEVTQTSRAVLDVMLGSSGRDEILANDIIHTHIVAVRSTPMTASDSKVLLAAGLGAAAVANALARPALAAFFERAVFANRPSAFTFKGFSTHSLTLDARNFDDAILASGSIPLVMAGITDVAGAPPGVYRDGGIIDYHFDFDFEAPDGLLLFPHFFDRITPGWFDKQLPWRTADKSGMDNVVMIAPSPAFVESLPHSRVPDREDFRRMGTQERQDVWQAVVQRCRVLADDLNDLMDGKRLAERAEPFT